MAFSLFSSTAAVFSLAILLRAALLVYGLFQDTYSPVKYTDIDYFVFTDAARFTAQGRSPYDRDTYRYTPLLAWLLLPTAGRGPIFFSFGKVLFAAADILAGWLITRILRRSMSEDRALKFANIWLLNPMVAAISTRGSSEGLLGVMVVALLWAVLSRWLFLAGFILGFSVHFKIYPFIYAASILWWLDDGIPSRVGLLFSKKGNSPGKTFGGKILDILTMGQWVVVVTSLITFMALNVLMYSIYGYPFIQHTYLHHVTRIDHRHNFSPYNTLLYLNSSPSSEPRSAYLHFESLAFLPQLILSAVIIPLCLAKWDLPSTMLAQTFAFVTFNKVCTSQYFLWYIIFLPFYLPQSSLLARPRLGIAAATLWILTQALWLQQGFNLEFLGLSTFVPGLWLASLAFFAVNVWILGIIVADIGSLNGAGTEVRRKER